MRGEDRKLNHIRFSIKTKEDRKSKRKKNRIMTTHRKKAYNRCN